MAAATHLDPARLAIARSALAEAASALGAPTPRMDAVRPRVSTGLADLDTALEGGLPRGRVVELSGRRSSGRMALTLRLIARATGSGEPAALVDVADALDPEDLPTEVRARVLWVRPTGLLDGLKAADVILDAGGFSLVALYLVGTGNIPGPGGRRPQVPSSAWARLAQRAERARAVLLVVTDGPGRGSLSPGAFASVGLDVRRRRAVWQGARLLDSVEGEVAVVRNRAGAIGAVSLLEPEAG